MEQQPGETLILLLDKLRKRLKDSGTERTAGLLLAMGNDCSFYRKSLDLFLKKDYDELKTLVGLINNEFTKIR